MATFRNGQWVHFKGSEVVHIIDGRQVPATHKTPGGRHVGIHVVEDGRSIIYPVSPTGENVPDGRGGNVKFNTDEVDVEPLLDKLHIPEERRKTLHKDFVLRP